MDEKLQIYSEGDHSKGSLYSDLQDSDEIRLLCLEPGSNGDRIECYIKHAKFSDQPQYEALSYMWGPKNAIQTIVISERNIDVRENLWLALRHLRLEAESRVLWIDAICINQQNAQERNHQVTQMGNIYNQATRVVVWLGASNSSSRLAFEVLSSTKGTEFITPSKDTKRVSKINKKLNAINGLLTREYWKRLWIIQEFLMAKEFIIQCGDETCSGFRFCWFMELLRTAEVKPTRINVGDSIASNMATTKAMCDSIPARLCRMRSQKVPNESNNGTGLLFQPKFGSQSNYVSQSLFKLFLNYRTAECEDRRDTIFGLHSLATACCKQVIPVDYSLTWRQILERLVRHQVLQHNFIPACVWIESQELIVSSLRNFYGEVGARSPRSYIEDVQPKQTNAPRDFEEAFIHWAYTKTLWQEQLIPGEIFRVRGYIRGRVSCTSLPSGRVSRKFIRGSIPKLTPRLKLQIEYICKLGDSNVGHALPHATTEIDIIESVKAGLHTSSLVCGTEQAVSSLWQDCSIDYWGDNFPWPTAADNDSDLIENVRDLLQATEKWPGSNHILAFEENGLVFFASKETQVGDLVCQFPGSDVLAVIHPCPNPNLGFNYSPSKYNELDVWRAVNFLASPPNIAADICGKPMSFDKAGLHFFEFPLRFHEMKTLCRSSDRPNGEHNI